MSLIPKPPTKQSGAAIIVALFMMALIAIAASAMIEHFRIDLYRTELLFNDTRANLYSEGSIAWAKETLNKNWRTKQPNKIVDNTPIHSPADKVEEAIIQATITDQEGFFNLNNLTDNEALADFSRLIHIIDPDTSLDAAKNISVNVRDWITPSNKMDEFYLKQNPSYRPPHRPMVSISELRLVKGISAKLFHKLAPYITALPERTKINVNNAPWPLIMCLNPTMSPDAARAIENYSKKNPFQTTQQFLQYDVVKNNPINEAKISVISSYFLVKTNVKIAHQETTRYMLLHRMIKNSEPYEVTVWQSKGTL